MNVSEARQQGEQPTVTEDDRALAIRRIAIERDGLERERHVRPPHAGRQGRSRRSDASEPNR